MPQEDVNALSELRFPVLCFSADDIFPVRSCTDLTTGTSYALRRRRYQNLEIIDQGNALVKVTEVKKVSGIGPFWGYNIFLNQRIKLHFAVDKVKTVLDFEDVKRRVLATVHRSMLWNSLVGFDELKADLERSTDTQGLIETLLRYWAPPWRNGVP